MGIKNKITKGEKLVIEIFKKRFNLDLEKIIEGSSQTPDFYLKKKGKKIAVVEVKDLEEINPTSKNTYGYKENDFGVWFKNDNSASRVSKRISEAYSQLKNTSNFPKIIILVNFSLSLDALDLLGTLQDYLLYVSKDGMSVKNLSPYNKINSNIRGKFKNVDLYLWVETNTQKIERIGYDLIFYPNNKTLIKKFKK